MTLQISQPELGRILGRGPWGSDVDSFAQELVALLPELFREIPAAQVQASPTSAANAPLQLEAFPADPTATPFATVTDGALQYNVTIDPTTGQLSSSPNLYPGQLPPPPKKKPKTNPPAPTTIPGQVVSGTGATYQVAIYQQGLSGGSNLVEVTQLGIDPSETIPAGTWAMVTQITSVDPEGNVLLEGSYMQVAVFL